MKILEHNIETGEIVEREMNKAEADQYAKDQAEKQAQIAKIQSDAIAKAALLERLGITEDEAKLLLG